MGLNFLNRFVVSVSFLGRLLLNRQEWRCDRPFLFRAGSAVFCVITSGEILAWLTRCFLNCHLVVHFIPLLNWRLKWLALGRVDQHVFIRLQLRSVNSENSVYDHWFFDTKGIRHCTRSVMAVVSSWLGCGLRNSSKRSNYSDLTRPHPKRLLRNGNLLFQENLGFWNIIIWPDLLVVWIMIGIVCCYVFQLLATAIYLWTHSDLNRENLKTQVVLCVIKITLGTSNHGTLAVHAQSPCPPPSKKSLNNKHPAGILKHKLELNSWFKKLFWILLAILNLTPQKLMCHLKRDHFKRKVVFKPSRC